MMFGAGLELRHMSISELMHRPERARRIEVFTGAVGGAHGRLTKAAITGIEVEMDGIVVRIGGRGPRGDRGGDPSAEGETVIGPTGAVRVLMVTRPVPGRVNA